MEFTREIYWNVGHGALTLIPMYLLAIAAITLMVKAFLKRIAVYKQGQPLNRTDRLGARISDLLQNVLLQKKVTAVAWPGIFHGLFFWGFFLLFVGTTLIVIQADFTDLLFDYVFLKGTFYKLFSITLDVAGSLGDHGAADTGEARAVGPAADRLLAQLESRSPDRLPRVLEHLRQAKQFVPGIRDGLVGELGYGLRKRVDLGRALALEPEILIMDEPMAGMNVEEKEDMARFIIDIQEYRKIPVILVEHDMEVVMDISNRVAVLEWGHMIAEGPPEEIKDNPRVINAYLVEE